MPTVMKYQITVSTPDGDVVRHFDDPDWMVTALNAHPEWSPTGDRDYSGVERTLRNEFMVRDAVAACDAERAERAAERKAAIAWRTRHPEGLPPGDERHGDNGYQNYACRCRICADANAASFLQRKANNRDRLDQMPPQQHGTDNGYHYWHCKCDHCLAAHAAAHPKRPGRHSGPKPYDDWEIALLSANLGATLAELAEQTGRTVSAVQKKRARIRAEWRDLVDA